MGGSSSNVSKADIESLKKQISTITNDFEKFKRDFGDPSSKIAATVNYQDLADKITSIDTYNQRLSEQIAKNPGAIGDNLAVRLGNNKVTTDAITKGLETNTQFAQSLADVLTDGSKSYVNTLKGIKGETGSLASSKDVVKTSLYDTKYTMWCADGGVCDFPVMKQGGIVHRLSPDDDKVLRHIDRNGKHTLAFATGNIWAEDYKTHNGRSVIKELDHLNSVTSIMWDNYVRKDKKYAIKSSRGGYLSDQGGWKEKPVNKDKWEVMTLEELPF